MRKSRRQRVQRSNEESFDRFVAGFKRTEVRRGSEWNVQPVSGQQAQKEYVCPGCGQAVGIGTAHLVAWRADGIMGDAADLAARRHWHTHCWRIN